MEPRRPKHLQQPPLVVAPEELERALQQRETYAYARSTDDPNDNDDPVFPCDSTDPIAMKQTHMSMVFLLPQRVYKLKKDVNFGFADFSTLYKRFQACYAEVTLNKRLAPRVYVGVVPISMHRATRRMTLRCDDFWTPERNAQLDYWVDPLYGEIVEWAVHMVRLPDDHTLEHLLHEHALSQSMLTQVADLLVAFHRDARRSEAIDAFGRDAVIRHNVDENFVQTQPHVGVTVTDRVYDRVRALTYERLDALQSTIAARVTDNCICDSHGDLRLEHVYVDPSSQSSLSVDESAPHEFVVLDCIEFNEQFRFGDPLADVAFLVMDLWHQGRPDLAQFLQQQYLVRASQDTPEVAALFRFYVAYRAVVRAKVGGFRVFDPTLSPLEREHQVAQARSYWLVALTFLAPPAERPCVILVAGLPATGKSSLARALAGDEQSVTWLRADAIRKELVGRQSAEPNDTDGTITHRRKAVDTAADSDPDAALAKAGSFEEGLYAPAITQRTYDELLIRAVGHLRLGERAVVDATFRDVALRERFVQAAVAEGARVAFVVCTCDREIVRGRLLARQNDVSDATWDVFAAMEKTWDGFAAAPLGAECFVVRTEKEPELTLRRTHGFLRSVGLL